MKINELGEFALIEDLAGLLPVGEEVIRGIGDDAAVVPGRMKSGYLLITTDSIVEGVHFRRSATARRIGRKALAVNLSDIAAMGGVPRWAVVNLGLPPELTVRYCRQLYRGMSMLAEEYGLGIVGGDTFRSSPGIVISVTVIGEVEKERCVFRDGAMPGDVLCLTGSIGEKGRGKHLDFTPRIREARYLVETFSPTAMIDLSDGLFADLDKLCRASGVGAMVGEEAIPVPRSIREKGSRAVMRASGRGEEFELLTTLPENEVPAFCRGLREKFGVRATPIGTILADATRRELIGADGESRPIPVTGYTHF